MNDKQVSRLLDGDAWIEYLGNLYEYIGRSHGENIFSDINDGYTIRISDNALKYSTEFYFTEKY